MYYHHRCGSYQNSNPKYTNMKWMKTVAIMIPNLIGNIADWIKIKRIANKYKLLIIEDLPLIPSLPFPSSSRIDDNLLLVEVELSELSY